MRLIFDSTRIPRSTTRQEWKGIWRWKRLTEKALSKEEAQMRENLAIYGTTLPLTVKEDMYNRLINPPVIIYPDFKVLKCGS